MDVRIEADGFLAELLTIDARTPSEQRIALRRGGLLHLTLRTAANGPGAGYVLSVEAADRETPAPNSDRATADAQGLASMRLSPGRYRIQVLRGWDSEDAVATAEVTLTEGAESRVEIHAP